MSLRVNLLKDCMPTCKMARFEECVLRLPFYSLRYTIDTILHGKSEFILPMLSRHCDNEQLDKNVRQR